MSAPGAASAVTTLHLVVRVGGERFAFPASHVAEALDAPAVAWVPAAPAGMLGQLSHRGRMVSAWDAAWVFRLAKPALAGAAIVLRDAARGFALVVDDVLETVPVDPIELRAVPAGADADGVLRGLCFPGGAGGDVTNVVDAVAVASLVSGTGTRGLGAPR